MKQWRFALALLGVGFAGAVWMHWPAPAGDVVSAYRKLPVMHYRMVQTDAMVFAEAKAYQGLRFVPRTDGTGSFEIRCKGVPVLVVENTPARVLVRLPADGLRRAPDVAWLLDTQRLWLVPEPGNAAVGGMRGKPSWWEARWREVVERVPRRQRCLLEGDRQGPAPVELARLFWQGVVVRWGQRPFPSELDATSRVLRDSEGGAVGGIEVEGSYWHGTDHG